MDPPDVSTLDQRHAHLPAREQHSPLTLHELLIIDRVELFIAVFTKYSRNFPVQCLSFDKFAFVLNILKQNLLQTRQFRAHSTRKKGSAQCTHAHNPKRINLCVSWLIRGSQRLWPFNRGIDGNLLASSSPIFFVLSDRSSPNADEISCIVLPLTSRIANDSLHIGSIENGRFSLIFSTISRTHKIGYMCTNGRVLQQQIKMVHSLCI